MMRGMRAAVPLFLITVAVPTPAAAAVGMDATRQSRLPDATRPAGVVDSSRLHRVYNAQAAPEAAGVHEVIVRMGGARVRALCTPGTTEVVLLHGEGSTSETWRPVLERLDGRVGACAYDRIGSGESRPVPEPRGWYELLDELRRIHRALGAEPPYVMVGQGLGGMYARVYAGDRPLDVGGLVLIEPAHGDLPRRMRTGMPEADWNEWEARRNRPNADGVVERRVAERTDRLRSARIPVTVLTATRRRDGEGWDARFLNEAARRVHESMVRGLSLGRHVPAEGSGPLIQQEDPDRVAEEIFRVVAYTRGR